MLLAFCATFAFAATQGQRRADGNSLLIKFTEKVDAGSLANTYSDGEFVLTRTADTNNKHAIDANDAYFGTAESYVKFDYRFKTGGKSSSSNSLQLTIPAAGTLKVYARTASSSATDRNVVLTQDGAELYKAVVKDADAVDVVINEESKKVYPVIAVEVNAGTVDVTYPVGALNFYGFELATAGEEAGPKNIEISPESGSDIGAVLAAEVEGMEEIGNITINLEENGYYTISKSIVASQSLVINGNGATIDASTLDGAGFISYTTVRGVKAMKDESTESAYTVVENVTVKDVEISGLIKPIINNTYSKVLFKTILINNCVIEITGNFNAFNLGVAYPENLKIEKTTIWSNEGHKGFFFKADGKPADITSTATTTWTVDHCTLVNISVDKKANNSNGGIKGKKTTTMVLTNSILYNFGSKSGNEVNGWLWGQNGGANAIYTNNTYWSADGAVFGWTDSSKGGSDQTGTALTTDPYFKDPYNGDFAVEAASDQAAKETGDQRWGTWTAAGTEFAITIGESENGTVTVDNPNAVEGTEVTITATPAEGYEVDAMTVKDADGNEITVTDGKFIMPAKAVTVTVTFKLSTGISNISADKSLEGAVFYNLNGQRVEKPAKGLYIVNGKKVVIK